MTTKGGKSLAVSILHLVGRFSRRRDTAGDFRSGCDEERTICVVDSYQWSVLASNTCLSDGSPVVDDNEKWEVGRVTKTMDGIMVQRHKTGHRIVHTTPCTTIVWYGTILYNTIIIRVQYYCIHQK